MPGRRFIVCLESCVVVVGLLTAGVATTQTVIVPFGSCGWKYAAGVGGSTQSLSARELDDSEWAIGCSPFVAPWGCLSPGTAIPINTRIVVRRHIYNHGNETVLRYKVSSRGGVAVGYNGNQHQGMGYFNQCPPYLLTGSLMLPPGDNAFIVDFGSYETGQLGGHADVELSVDDAGGWPTATSLRSLPNPSTCGEDVELSIDVDPPAATGIVDLVADGNVVASGSLIGGNTVLHLSSMQSGTHSLVASYRGDTSRPPSTSTPVVHTVECQVSVREVLEAGHFKLTAAPNPVQSGVLFNVQGASRGEQSLTIVDLQGRTVRRLPLGLGMSGMHQVGWNGTDESGVRVRPGVFHVVLWSGNRRTQARVIVF